MSRDDSTFMAVRPAGTETRGAPRYRILCVDDEPAIRDLLRLLLRREGYAVETAPDGLAAWEMFSRETEPFDLVITDNDMPSLTGLGLVERLRGAGFAGEVVMFSASVTKQAGDRLKGLSVAAVVLKGGSVRELLGHVRRLAAGT